MPVRSDDNDAVQKLLLSHPWLFLDVHHSIWTGYYPGGSMQAHRLHTYCAAACEPMNKIRHVALYPAGTQTCTCV